MGLATVFRKNKLSKVPLPKLSSLVQIGEEILVALCSDDFI